MTTEGHLHGETVLKPKTVLNYVEENEERLWNNGGISERQEEVFVHQTDNVGNKILGHGKCVKLIHDYFSKLEPRKCCMSLTTCKTSFHNVRLVRSDGRDSGIEEGAMMKSSVDSSVPVFELDDEEMRMFRYAFMCASFPVLGAPEPPPALSPSSTADQDKRFTGLLTSSRPITPYSLQDSGVEEQDDTSIVPAETLYELLRRAFRLTSDKFYQYEQYICEKYGKQAPQRILAEELVGQLAALENNSNPFYNPHDFMTRHGYDQWHRHQFNQIAELMKKFWHSSYPPPMISYVKHLEMVHNDYRLLLYKLIRYESPYRHGDESHGTGLTAPLSSASQRLLKEFGLRYGIGDLYRKIVYLHYLAHHYEPTVWFIQHTCTVLSSILDILSNFVLVRKEHEMFKESIDTLETSESSTLCKMKSVFPRNRPSDGIESLIELISKTLQARSVLLLEKSENLKDYLLLQIQTIFPACYTEHKTVVISEMRSSELEPNPTLLNMMIGKVRDEVMDYKMHYQVTFEKYFDVVEVASHALYSLLMDDIIKLCQSRQEKERTLQINRLMLGLGYRLNQLDMDWSLYISPVAQTWREWFLKEEVQWITVLQSRMQEMVITAVGRDKFKTTVFTDVGPIVQTSSTSSHSRDRSISLKSLTPSVNSAFSSLMSSYNSTPLQNVNRLSVSSDGCFRQYPTILESTGKDGDGSGTRMASSESQKQNTRQKIEFLDKHVVYSGKKNYHGGETRSLLEFEDEEEEKQVYVQIRHGYSLPDMLSKSYDHNLTPRSRSSVNQLHNFCESQTSESDLIKNSSNQQFGNEGTNSERFDVRENGDELNKSLSVKCDETMEITGRVCVDQNVNCGNKCSNHDNECNSNGDINHDNNCSYHDDCDHGNQNSCDNKCHEYNNMSQNNQHDKCHEHVGFNYGNGSHDDKDNHDDRCHDHVSFKYDNSSHEDKDNNIDSCHDHASHSYDNSSHDDKDSLAGEFSENSGTITDHLEHSESERSESPDCNFNFPPVSEVASLDSKPFTVNNLESEEQNNLSHIDRNYSKCGNSISTNQSTEQIHPTKTLQLPPYSRTVSSDSQSKQSEPVTNDRDQSHRLNMVAKLLLSASVIDLIVVLQRLIGIGTVLCQTFCPVRKRRHDVDGSVDARKRRHDVDGSVDACSDVFSDSVILSSRQRLYESLFDAMCNTVALYADNMLCMDLCGTTKTTAVKLIGPQLLEHMDLHRKNKLIWGCRHDLHGVQDCFSYVNRKTDLLCDRHEPITEEMCTRLNNVHVLVYYLDVYHQKLSNNINVRRTQNQNNKPLSPVMDDRNDFGRSFDSETDQNSFVAMETTSENSSDECSLAPKSVYLQTSSTNPYQRHLQAVMRAQCRLMAYRINLFVHDALHILLILKAQLTPVSTCLLPLTQFLQSYMNNMKKWLYTQCYNVVTECLWIFIVQDFEEELLNVQHTDIRIEEHAKILIQALSYLIQFMNNQENGIRRNLLLSQAEDVMFKLQLHATPTPQLIILFKSLQDYYGDSDTASIHSYDDLVQTLMYRMREELQQYRKCFSGTQLVKWISQNPELFLRFDGDISTVNARNKREKCIAIAEQLLFDGVVIDIDAEMYHNESFGDGSLLSSLDEYPELIIHDKLVSTSEMSDNESTPRASPVPRDRRPPHTLSKEIGRYHSARSTPLMRGARLTPVNRSITPSTRNKNFWLTGEFLMKHDQYQRERISPELKLVSGCDSRFPSDSRRTPTPIPGYESRGFIPDSQRPPSSASSYILSTMQYIDSNTTFEDSHTKFYYIASFAETSTSARPSSSHSNRDSQEICALVDECFQKKIMPDFILSVLNMRIKYDLDAKIFLQRYSEVQRDFGSQRQACDIS